MSLETSPQGSQEASAAARFAELLPNISAHHRHHLITEAIQALQHNNQMDVTLPFVQEELTKLIRKFHRRGYGDCDPEYLLRAAMYQYQTDDMYAEHRSTQLIQSYEEWLHEHSFHTSTLSEEAYQDLVAEAVELIASGETNIPQELRNSGVTVETLDDQQLQQLISEAYEKYGTSFTQST